MSRAKKLLNAVMVAVFVACTCMAACGQEYTYSLPSGTYYLKHLSWFISPPPEPNPDDIVVCPRHVRLTELALDPGLMAIWFNQEPLPPDLWTYQPGDYYNQPSIVFADQADPCELAADEGLRIDLVYVPEN